MSRKRLVSQQWWIWQSRHLVFEQFRFSCLIEFPFLEVFIEACIELILMFILSIYLSFMFIEEFLESIHGIFLELFIEFQALSTVCWFDMMHSSTNFFQRNGRPTNSREIIDACWNAVWIIILACTVLFCAIKVVECFLEEKTIPCIFFINGPKFCCEVIQVIKAETRCGFSKVFQVVIGATEDFWTTETLSK